MIPPELVIMARIREGMNVCDLEGVKVGTVEQMYMGVPYGEPPPYIAPNIAPTIVEPFIRVDHHGQDLYIPSGAISDVTNDCVVLNVLRDRIPEQGWDQRPFYIQG
jgi:hypothetical protein